MKLQRTLAATIVAPDRATLVKGIQDWAQSLLNEEIDAWEGEASIKSKSGYQVRVHWTTADMKDIHVCVICHKALEPKRDHVDTCSKLCFKRLLDIQRVDRDLERRNIEKGDRK